MSAVLLSFFRHCGLPLVTIGNHLAMSAYQVKNKGNIALNLCCSLFFLYLSKVFATVMPSAMSPPAHDMKGKTELTHKEENG